MNRREFLSTAAGTALVLPAVAKETPMMPIVDTHQHLWDMKKTKLAWVKPGDALAIDSTPVEYAKATEGLGVVKAVYMEVDVVPDQQQAEVDYILELIKSKSSPTVAAVISGRPNAGEAFKKYVAQFKGSPFIKGLRQVIHVDSTPSGYCTTKEFIAGVRHLGEIGLSFDICIRPADLPDAVKLINECPDTRFILDHCGNAPILDELKMKTWKKDIAAVAAKKNVVGKVSGIVASVKKDDWKIETLSPAINHTIEVFGWDRVMFGGDWPVCTLGMAYKQWVETLKAIVKDQSEERQKKLFHDNAVKFYGL
ncbi:amidohydrolase family protein [Zavarzinella formosa]|uniref:amidohydrolase family protein n=1 Tax=Zavarzinella formosa TaxID=360055 RepID=UPI0003132D36|nr:amidohydrolase family protein [Zavarzinella formosa]